jgi:hypothetical protein
MGIWTQVETDAQIHVCSHMLQTSRTRYKGHLTHKNLAKLLAQTKHEDHSPMFEMYLYQDSITSDYDLVLVAYRTLNRNSSGTPQFDQWCLTFGVSPTTTKTASALYAILKAEVQQQMTEDGITFWYVYLNTDSTFNSVSLFDQIVQSLFADIAAGNVITSNDQPVTPYAAYANDNPNATTLHRFEIQQIN